MARIRTIKPEIWQDEDLAAVSEAAMLLAIGLLNHADDEGFFRANVKLIKAAVFPLREFTDQSVTIHGLLTELSRGGYLTLFSADDGKDYGHITNFTKHQVINRPKPSKIKDLKRITDRSLIDHGSVTDESLGKGKERKGKDKENSPSGSKRKTAKPETTPPGVDPQAWSDYCQHRESNAALRKGWTQVARGKAAAILATIKNPTHQRAVVDYTVVGGYTGLYPERINATNHRPADGRNRQDRFLDNLKQWADEDDDGFSDPDPEGLDRGPVREASGPVRPQMGDILPARAAESDDG